MLSQVDKANEIIREKGQDICVGSGDATALYPSLRHDLSSKLCSEVIKNCPAKFNNIDGRAAAIFIYTHCTESEIKAAGLQKLIPLRKFAKGHKPSTITPELTTRTLEGDDGPPSKFCPIKDFTPWK